MNKCDCCGKTEEEIMKENNSDNVEWYECNNYKEKRFCGDCCFRLDVDEMTCPDCTNIQYVDLI